MDKSGYQPANQTGRALPALSGRSGELAQQLRHASVDVDEVKRARMERSLVQAWRARGAVRVSGAIASDLPAVTNLKRRGPSARQWMFSVAASAMVGALFGVYVLSSSHLGHAPLVEVAQFELRIAEGALQTGSLAEGQSLESGPHGRVQVSIGKSHVEMANATRVRFDRISARELRLALANGKVDIEFNPAVKGEQKMLVETRSAQVRVVGTRFSVQADWAGNTVVRVTEGVVEVVPRDGRATQRVVAGGSVNVPIDGGDSSERATREAIAAGIAEQAPAAPDMELGLDEIDGLSAALPAAPSPSPAAASNAITAAQWSARLSAARDLLRAGKHNIARQKLRTIASSADGSSARAEALTLIAESYTAQGDIPHASQAYRAVIDAAPDRTARHNAVFALARLLDRFTQDRKGASVAYAQYLHEAPKGALAPQARQALCRLGEPGACTSH